jgi:hypothetical protein
MCVGTAANELAANLKRTECCCGPEAYCAAYFTKAVLQVLNNTTRIRDISVVQGFFWLTTFPSGTNF